MKFALATWFLPELALAYTTTTTTIASSELPKEVKGNIFPTYIYSLPSLELYCFCGN